ncbi:uncharacterized protein [Parasteatoda tepidariorum]|uniref:uncharacterized protein n=1 Tax=Parasteatoda tepidariorum TaxID=114398 RepID=UPI00077FA10F|nr:Golgi-associated plant pathogenesis-related protein 1 [Parasteatoda tepidariorum]XP_015926696.1 Golgi-associated plant pathogenesis-related protein 1 [Parasteatoda tepidariorum]XP_015926697.1 Golgi-associated plant pathogenesis-related protein 1 [Parasteatoda tepidariorum]
MFKSKTKSTKDSDDAKVTKKIVTEKVETTGGIQTKTTTITCTKDDFDSAFKTLDLDPKKFHSGGTSVTRQIIYTDSSGKKEVIEETVETYDSPEKSEKPKNGSESKSFAQKLGLNLGKSDTTKSSEPKAAKTATVKPGQFEKECLEAHNEYRKVHGVPILTLSKEICAYAKEWADHLATTDRFEHRKEHKYGENIYMKWSSDPNHQVTGREAVDSWYSEIKDFTFGQEPKTLKSGHFTQVVWKESQKLGVAWARSKSGKILVVANYDPKGNFVGHFAQNVPPKKK